MTGEGTLRAVRGAVTVEADTAEAITDATREMLQEIVRRNAIAQYDLVSALFTQLFAGFVLGFFVSVIFSAVQSAGELMDLQVGFSLGGVIDPFSGNNSTPLGRMYQLIGVAILLAINGHIIVTRAFIHSVDTAPMGTLDFAQVAQSLARLVAVLLGPVAQKFLPALLRRQRSRRALRSFRAIAAASRRIAPRSFHDRIGLLGT